MNTDVATHLLAWRRYQPARRYDATRCNSCKAIAAGFIVVYTADRQKVGAWSTCVRHIPTWKRRLSEQFNVTPPQ